VALVEMTDYQRDQLQTFASTDPEDVQAKGDEAAHVKKYIFKNLHKGKKVIINANHNNMVSRHPTITGNWEDVTYF